MQKRMGHESARPRATLAGKVSTIAVSSLHPSTQIGNSRARHSNLASLERLASMPFWSRPNVLEFTLKGVQPGWRPDRSEGSSGEREVVINGGSRETWRDGSGKREFKGEMAAGAE